MHWADVAAKRLTEALGTDHGYTLATGITPSGHIHVGNMREILTAHLVHQGLVDLGVDARLLYLGDTIDPLRKVYPHLPSSYSKYVDMPLSEIPCPCGEHENYAEHYLDPFLESVKKLNVDMEIRYTHRMYEEGLYYDTIKKALEQRKSIIDILNDLSGRQLPEDWYPYNPICEKCGKMNHAKITGFRDPYVEYTCRCGHEGKSDIRKAQGKLPWRVDWPARWSHLEIDFEPFGKDHATQGGSYDTGKAIIEGIFGGRVPDYVVYEWIQLKGKGAMSSSKAIAVSAQDMLSITPPEVMKFLVAKSEPKKHIDFHPGLPILDLVDEYDRYERVYYGLETMGGKDISDQKRIYELSSIRDRTPNGELYQVPLRHLVTLVQLYPEVEVLMEKAVPPDADLGIKDYVRERVEAAKNWVEDFAPDRVKFHVILEVDEAAAQVDDDAKGHLAVLADRLDDTEWNPESIHNEFYECSKEIDISAKKLFHSVYRVFLGQKYGPRLGYFLSSMDKEYVLDRLRLE